MMFPYIIKVLQEYLQPLLVGDGIRVVTKLPVTVAGPVVVLSTSPAGASDKPEYLSWRRVIFQVYASDELAGGELLERVRSLVLASRYAGVGIRRVRVIGEPASFNDPDDSRPRFQMTADILVRAQYN